MQVPRFTPGQLEWLAAVVSGGRGNVAVAAAVAGAESSGLPSNYNVNNDPWRSIDRGLWQINNHYHPEVSDACAYTPICCARAAYRISNGWTDFHQWSTYNSGAYLEHMPPSHLLLQPPIPDAQLNARYSPSRDGVTPALVPGAPPFGHPPIEPSATDGGPDYSHKVRYAGQRGGYHGSVVNDGANAIIALAARRL